MATAQISRRRGGYHQPYDPAKAEELTPREKQIARLIALGRGSKEIAAELFLSPKTINTHRTNFMAKLDLHSIAAVVFYALRTGLVQLSDSAQ